MKKLLLALAVALALALPAAPALAFVPILADDARVVGEGAMVLTLDLANISYEGPGDATVLLATFDYGFNPTLDFRGVLPLWIDTPANESGLGDLLLGAKWSFAQRDEWSFSLFPYLVLATGDEDKGLGYGEVNLGANLLASWMEPNQGPWAVDINFDLYTVNVKNGDDDMGWALVGMGDYALDPAWSLLGGLEFENDGNDTANYLTFGAGYLLSQSVNFKGGLKLGLGDNGADSILFVRAVLAL